MLTSMNKPNQHPFSVLVVDDSRDSLNVVSNFLKHEGYQIVLSLDAEDAMRSLRINDIDLILLDVMMPGTDGFTMCRQLKKDERLADIPVVFLTAKTDTSDLVEGFRAGGADYITKPFQREELIARINNHVALADAKRRIMQQAEQIQKVNRTKDRLYSVIAHDIKTPFSNISMLISTLAEGYLEPGSAEYKEIIQNINNASQETYALLKDLLLWTRTQTGDLEMAPESIRLNKLVHSAIHFFKPNAATKNIALHMDVPEDLLMKADRNMMQSVLQNLISNAIKFTNEKGDVHISARKKANNIVIEIKDTGVGIPEESMKKLFVEEGQVTTRGTNDEKGSGLGLLLVKDFVQRNNGIIDLESIPGEGTTFILNFPSDR